MAYTIQETAKYFPNQLDPDDVIEMADELQEWVNAAGGHNIYSPEDLEAYLDDVEGKEYTKAEFDAVCKERDEALKQLECANDEIETLRARIAELERG